MIDPTPPNAVVTVIRNARPVATTFHVEPWGDVHLMPAGATFRVVAWGPRHGALEVELAEDAVTVWGWPGSVLKVFHGDVELGASYGDRPPVPSVPRCD